MRRRKLVPILATLFALAAAAPAPAAELGLNLNGGAAAGTDQNFNDLSALNSRWARHFLDYDNFEWNENGFAIYRRMVDEEGRRGVKTLITVKSAGNSPPASPQAFAAQMAQLARVLPGLEAIEIWNEADEGLFWAGGPDVQGYVNLLRVSYTAIKQVNPGITVVFSPTVGNNFGFVEAAYRAGAKDHFDAMAVHTDTACLDQAPGSYYREPDGRIGRFTFLGYREVHNVMQANGDGHKPIWMTEFGWSAVPAPNSCEFGAGAGQKPAGVSEAQQAEYLIAAMNCMARDPYVQVAMWYNSRDLKADGKMANMYGLRRFDGSERPAYGAFRTAASRPGDANAPCGDFEGPTSQPLDPKPGFVLAPGSTMTIRARADAPDLNKVFFRVEGPGAAPLFNGTNNNGITLNECSGGVCERVWGGARDLGNGQHKLLIWAVDNNGTAGPMTEIPFSKGVPYQGPGGTDGPGGAASFVKFPKLRLTGKGRKRTFRGGSLPGITSGAVRIEWYLKTKVKGKKGKKKTKWVRYHAKAVMARSPFIVKQKLRRHGKWRVRALYLGTTGIPKTPSCWTEFKTRSKKSKLVCPKGAIRPTKR